MAFREMKCPSCGANIEVDDSREIGFCLYCGCNIQLKDIIEVRHVNVGIDSGANRTNALEEVIRLKEYFGQYANEYVELKELEKKLKDGYNSESEIFIFEFIDLMVGILGILFAFVSMSVNSIVGIIICLIIAAIGGFSFVKMVIISNSRKKKFYEKSSRRQQQLGDLIQQNYDSYINCPVGIEYTDPEIIEKMYEVIRQGKAYSIKEALNLISLEPMK